VSTADAIGEVSAVPETLHMAARAGSLESVNMLLRNKADPDSKDSEGKTALDYAEAAGKADIAKVLKEAMKTEYNDEFEEPSPVAAAASSAIPPSSSSPPAASEPAAPPEKDVLDELIQEDIGSGYTETAKAVPESPPKQMRSTGSRGKSPAGTSNKQVNVHKEIKQRTEFPNATTDGVLKRTTFIHKLSTFRSAPEVSIGSRGESTFMRSSGGPAPGSYNLPEDDKNPKFRSTCHATFGGSSRFGLEGSFSKRPGPGQYNPVDPSQKADTKVGFGTSIRATLALKDNPGPGAYECRSTVGGGLMFTAHGRHVSAYMRSRSMPGPGAYTPAPGAFHTSPKCGFGTSVRGEINAGFSRGQPGPGTYEMQNSKCLGKDSTKHSATSRRLMHDLSSYVTPGPGTYNAHATSFGNPGATSCKHVDDKYGEREKMRQKSTSA
jgi:hypothetical protein